MENNVLHPAYQSELSRLNRAIGQLDGIRKMIKERRYCIEILQQLKASRLAIKNIEQSILNMHLKTCLFKATQTQNEDEILKKIEELQKIIKNYS